MEKDMNILIKILEENEQTVEKFLNIKLPIFYILYFKVRNIIKFVMKCIGILFLTITVSCLTVLLLTCACEMLNLYPLYKSLDAVHNFTLNSIQLFYTDDQIESNKCLINNIYMEYLRLPTSCDFCRNINKIKKVSNLSQKEFLDIYAYSGRPVIVTDATNDWTARTLFSFKFFQTIYSYALFLNSNKYSKFTSLFKREKLLLDDQISTLHDNEANELLTCQFFNYQTNYRNLEDFLANKADNFNKSNPWYVGWSNCNSLVSKILRQHYSIPYFLPNNSEPHNSDWIFIGYPGYGANMHIDFVGRPSWQAQLKGRKLWRLKPPQECLFKCPSNIEVIAEEGDIIVLDTNLWYHQTEIIGNEISVTVGAEYD